MRLTISYPVWEKADMIPWLMEGIFTNMYDVRDRVTVQFLFSDCEDDSVSCYDRYAPNILHEFRVLPRIVLMRDSTSIWKGGRSESLQHNVLMRAFMADPDGGEMLLVPQDDMKLNGNGICCAAAKSTLFKDIEALLDRFGDRLGCVTGRDTYYAHFSKSAGSAWTQSKVNTRLSNGEFYEGYAMNRGPILYPRHLIEKIGFLDTDRYRVGFTESDYSCRAHHAGFVVGAMGMDVLHAKFGKLKNTTLDYLGQVIQDDYRALIEKYPNANPW